MNRTLSVSSVLLLVLLSLAPLAGASAQSPAIADAARVSEAFADVAARVSPSVVTLRVEAPAPTRAELPFPFGGGGGGGEGIARGAGSGVVIRPDGYVLTNNHVVEHATQIDVVLRDGRVLSGEVVGTDRATDLAVVRVEASGLPALPFASSDRARVGEWVVAIGAPFGLEATVTAGVLSATGRGVGMNEIEDYLQTDASINPGNSGGPLVNLRGEVLGINTMIVGRGSGIGFAIPSDMARIVSDQLIQNGRVERAYIGVGFQELTAELSRHLGVRGARGALVSSVVTGGPAAQAGIQPGDVITAVEGSAVGESRDLQRQVIRRPVGARLALTVVREGRSRTVSVTTGARPGSEQHARAPRRGAPTTAPRASGSGASVAAITPDVQRRLGYQGAGRVVVTGVAPGSPAEHAGLRRGDVVVRADGKLLERPEQLERSFADDGAALLHVERGDGAFFTVVERRR
jgi:Do/DeqQ family serine protease